MIRRLQCYFYLLFRNALTFPQRTRVEYATSRTAASDGDETSAAVVVVEDEAAGPSAGGVHCIPVFAHELWKLLLRRSGEKLIDNRLLANTD